MKIKTTKSIEVITLNGEVLDLTPAQLQQREIVDGRPAFFTNRAALRNAYQPDKRNVYQPDKNRHPYGSVLVTRVLKKKHGTKKRVHVTFDHYEKGTRNIGCCKFSDKTFALIFKTMGLPVPKRVR